jgi:hypothetical protein
MLVLRITQKSAAEIDVPSASPIWTHYATIRALRNLLKKPSSRSR